jgi:hypothetical protein
MNTSDKDKELKKWMKQIRLETPDPAFSSKVMKVILAEKQKESAYLSEPLLGKKFWMLVILFIALILVFMLIPGEKSVPQTAILEEFFSGLPKPGWNQINVFFSEISHKIGSLSLTLAAVMFGASALLLADNFFTRIRKISPV